NDLSRTTHIVFVFFSTTCHHCQDETQAMGKNFSDFSQSTLYFISREEKGEIEKFMNVYGKDLKDKANVHVLRDPRSEFIVKFSPSQYPSVYVYTPTRRLVKHFSGETPIEEDRKSTRLNSSHVKISYAVFCLKKKNTNRTINN